MGDSYNVHFVAHGGLYWCSRLCCSYKYLAQAEIRNGYCSVHNITTCWECPGRHTWIDCRTCMDEIIQWQVTNKWQNWGFVRRTTHVLVRVSCRFLLVLTPNTGKYLGWDVNSVTYEKRLIRLAYILLANRLPSLSAGRRTGTVWYHAHVVARRTSSLSTPSDHTFSWRHGSNRVSCRYVDVALPSVFGTSPKRNIGRLWSCENFSDFLREKLLIFWRFCVLFYVLATENPQLQFLKT